MKHVLLAIATLFACQFLAAQDFNQPADVLRIMDESKLQYVVMIEQGDVHEPLELGNPNVPFTYAKEEDGKWGPASYDFDSLVNPIYQQAEKDFVKGDIKAAREGYMKVLEQQPELAVVMTFLGQTYEHEKNYPEAMKWYRKAISLNFHDYMAHWFLADNLWKLKQYDEAAKEIAVAWVLNRNNKSIAAALVELFKDDKRKFDAAEFDPNYSLVKKGEEIQIRFSEDWMMYAFCKALWKYEPGYHRELGGGRNEFDMTQEKECLLNLAIAYEKTNKGKKGKNPLINRLMAALEARKVNEFIFMERWLRMEPLIAYTQPKEAILAIADYVLEIRAPKK